MSNSLRLALSAALFVALPAMASAQFSSEAPRVEATTPTPALAGPRTSTVRFAHDVQPLMPRTAADKLPGVDGGSNTIVISTLALVLGIVLIIVLIAR